MGETKQGSCETKQGSCETATQDCHGKCPCGCGCDGACPMHMGMCALHEAKKAVMVDILKVKIQKAWGPKMDQFADLIIQAMEAKKKGECELKNKIHELMGK